METIVAQTNGRQRLSLHFASAVSAKCRREVDQAVILLVGGIITTVIDHFTVFLIFRIF